MLLAAVERVLSWGVVWSLLVDLRWHFPPNIHKHHANVTFRDSASVGLCPLFLDRLFPEIFSNTKWTCVGILIFWQRGFFVSMLVVWNFALYRAQVKANARTCNKFGASGLTHLQTLANIEVPIWFQRSRIESHWSLLWKKTTNQVTFGRNILHTPKRKSQPTVFQLYLSIFWFACKNVTWLQFPWLEAKVQQSRDLQNSIFGHNKVLQTKTTL